MANEVKTTRASAKPLARRSSLETIKTFFYKQEWQFPTLITNAQEINSTIQLGLIHLLRVLKSYGKLRELFTYNLAVMTILIFLLGQCHACAVAAIVFDAPSGFWFLIACLSVITFIAAVTLFPNRRIKFTIHKNKFL